MTKAKLTVWIDWDSDKTGAGMGFGGPNAMEIDILVTEPDKKVVIEIDAQKLTMNSPYKPRLVTLPEPEEA